MKPTEHSLLTGADDESEQDTKHTQSKAQTTIKRTLKTENIDKTGRTVKNYKDVYKEQGIDGILNSILFYVSLIIIIICIIFIFLNLLAIY